MNLRIDYIKRFCEAVRMCKDELGWTDIKVYCVLNQAGITVTDLSYAEEPELEVIMRKGIKYIPIDRKFTP